MTHRIRNCTIWLVIIIILTGCDPSLSNNRQPPATELPVTSTPHPTATHLPATVTSTTTPLPSQTSTLASTSKSTPQVPQPVPDTTFVFIGETIPDGTNLQPGQKFKKTWTLKNGGNSTWNKGTVLVRTSSSPVNETLGSPDQIPLSKEVDPGATIEIEVDLVAPKQNGQFTVFYQLLNEAGSIVPNSQIWVAITVGNVPFSDTGGITAQLVSSSMQNAEFTMNFCMHLPDGRQWYPWGVNLLVNQQKYTPTGSSIDPAGATTANKCFSFGFPVSIASGTNYELAIEKVELPPEVNQAENCAYAQRTLRAIYPGLDFKCSGPGSWYFDLVLPSGMTKEQADRLILDAMSSSIYGPWTLNGTAP
jgi:hypothetical protein